MSKRIDWNLRMVGSREAKRLMPKRQNNPKEIDWASMLVGHLDTGYTEHPVFGDWASGGEWMKPDKGINLRESDTLPKDPLD